MTLFPPTCVGRFLVSPLAKLLDNGLFGASVSIRSGSGSAAATNHHRPPGTSVRVITQASGMPTTTQVAATAAATSATATAFFRLP